MGIAVRVRLLLHQAQRRFTKHPARDILRSSDWRRNSPVVSSSADAVSTGQLDIAEADEFIIQFFNRPPR